MGYIKKEIGIVNVNFGENVKVVHPVNLYGCEIGDNSFIGPFVEIQKNVKKPCLFACIPGIKMDHISILFES